MFAEASNEFYGQWVIVALGIIGGLGGLAAIASYFATRRDLDGLIERVADTERDIAGIRAEMKQDLQTLMKAGEDRAEKLHIRINDVLEAVSELRGEVRAK